MLPMESQLSQAARFWEPLIQKVGLFVSVVDGIAELHPYATLAWSLLSWVPKTLISQLERDNNVRALGGVISDALSFVQDAEPLKAWKSIRESNQHRVLARIVQQVVECCRFMRTYADKGFWTRAVTNWFTASHVDAQIQGYITVVSQLKMEFHARAAIDTQILVHRVLDNMTQEGIQDRNQSFTPSDSVRQLRRSDSADIFSEDKEYSSCTRTDVLNNIIRWIENPDDHSRVLLLTGVENTGKSSIVREIARRYVNLGRLASTFTFDSGLASVSRQPHLLFTSIARDLAEFDQEYAQALDEAIKAHADITSSTDCEQLFAQLIYRPISRLSVVGPIVIAIDSLDMIAGAQNRQALLSVLSNPNRMGSIPPNVRIIISSRASRDIEHTLGLAQFVYRVQI